MAAPVCALVKRINLMPFVAVCVVFTVILEPFEPIQSVCVTLGEVIAGQKKKPKSRSEERRVGKEF